MVNFDLTAEQLELQQKAREFAINEVLPVAWYFDEQDQIPIFILKKAWEAGLMNLGIPQQYGGKGYGLMEEVLAVEEFAAACPGMGTSIFANS